jgi:hypothetical protein
MVDSLVKGIPFLLRIYYLLLALVKKMSSIFAIKYFGYILATVIHGFENTGIDKTGGPQRARSTVVWVGGSLGSFQ